MLFLYPSSPLKIVLLLNPNFNYPNWSMSSVSLRTVIDTGEKNRNSPLLLLTNVSQISQGSRALMLRGQIPRIPSTAAQQYSILTPYFYQPCLRLNSLYPFPMTLSPNVTINEFAYGC